MGEKFPIIYLPANRDLVLESKNILEGQEEMLIEVSTYKNLLGGNFGKRKVIMKLKECNEPRGH